MQDLSSKNINQTQSSFSTILKDDISTNYGTQLKNGHKLGDKANLDEYFLDGQCEDLLKTDEEKNLTDSEKLDVRRSMSHSLSEIFVNTQKKSSFLTSVLNIVNTTVGLGILSFPYVIKIFGIILGSIITIIVYVLTLFSCRILLKARKYCKKPNQDDYHKLAVISFGKAGEIIIQFIICITMLGICICLQQIFVVTIKSILDEYASSFDTFWLSTKFFIILSFLSRLPFIFARTTEKLKFASYIASTAIITFIFVVVYNFAVQIQNGLPKFSWVPDQFCTFQQSLLCLSVVALAFGFQMNLYPIYKCLEKPSDKKMMNVCYTSQSAIVIIYLGLGIIGYVSAGAIGTNQDFLTNFNVTNLGKVIYLILYIAYSMVAIFHFPLFFFQGRNTLFFLIRELMIKLKIVKDKKKEILEQLKSGNTPISNFIDKEEKKRILPKDKDILYFIYSLILYVIIVVLGVFWSNLLDAFGLIGSIGANNISYILPALFYIILASQRKKTKTYKANLLFLAFGIISFLVCTGVAVYELT